MIVAVASGKGGTGTTTIATNLARVADRTGRSVVYLDCDVEEPNGAIFLKPRIELDRAVTRPVPRVDPAKCTACGDCVRVCRFGAIVSLPGGVQTLPELCHGCGACRLACPADAVAEEPLEIGRLQTGRNGHIRFVQGLLKVGRVRSLPVIRAVKDAAPEAELMIIDCPPGAGSDVIAAATGADCAVLVAEPTPFGLHDLQIAVEAMRAMHLPLRVVINRCDCGDAAVRDYCAAEKIEVLAEIPDVRAVAEAFSRGVLASEASPHYRSGFERMVETLCSPEAEVDI